MSLRISKDGIDFDINPSDTFVKSVTRGLFWTFLGVIVFSIVNPDTATEYLELIVEQAKKMKEKWSEKLSKWGRILVDMVVDWGGYLIDGGLSIIRWSLAVTVILAITLPAMMWLTPGLTPVIVLIIGLAVLVATIILQFIPGKLIGDKKRAREVFGVLAMWPIAVTFAIVCFPIGKLSGMFILMGCLLAVYYLIKGGKIMVARVVANLVLWAAIWFQIVTTGIPALQTGIAGGWAKELATGVSTWDAKRDKTGDINLDRERVYRERTFGRATDTIAVAMLPVYLDGNVTINEVATWILPDEELEILSDQRATAWGKEFNDPLLSAIGDTTRHVRANAKREMGYVEVELVAFKNLTKRRAFLRAYGSVAFYVAWGSVRGYPDLTAESGESARQTAELEDEPMRFTLTGLVNGTPVTCSTPVTEVIGTKDEDDWVNVDVDTRYPVIAVPLPLARDDELELEYDGGTIGHYRLPGGGFDPKYSDSKGVHHYTHDVGPAGYSPDPAMGQPWKNAQVQLLKQGEPYMTLLWSTTPMNSGFIKAFGFGEDYASFMVDAPADKLYLAFNDAWCDEHGGGASYLNKQCWRRVGSIKIRIRVVKPEPAREQVGLAVYD